jgi:hypothetical protein
MMMGGFQGAVIRGVDLASQLEIGILFNLGGIVPVMEMNQICL